MTNKVHILPALLLPLILTGCLGGSGGDSEPYNDADNSSSDQTSSQAELAMERQSEQCGSTYPLEQHWDICDAFFKVYPEYEPKGLWMPSGYRRPKQHFFIPGLIDAATDLNLTGEGVNIIIDDGFFSWHEVYSSSRLTNDSLRTISAEASPSQGDNVTERLFGWANVFLDEMDSHGTAVYSMAAGRIGIANNSTVTLLASSYYVNDSLIFRYAADNYEYAPAGVMNSSHTGYHYVENHWYSSSSERTDVKKDDMTEVINYVSRGGVFVLGAGNDDGFSLSESGASGLVSWDKGCVSFDNEDPRKRFKPGVSEPICEAAPLHEVIPDSIIYAGSIDMDTNQLSEFSNIPGMNTDIQKRFILAPGNQVTVASTYSWDGFVMIHSEEGTRPTFGTSFSAPTVSAAIALVKEAMPELDYKEAMQWVLDNADNSFAGYDPVFHGVGRLSLANLNK